MDNVAVVRVDNLEERVQREKLGGVEGEKKNKKHKKEGEKKIVNLPRRRRDRVVSSRAVPNRGGV